MILHSLLYFLVRAVSGVLAIAILAVFTRLLSPQEYGVYAIGIAIATIASAILFQWLNVAVGRFYPIHRDNPVVILSAIERGFWAATAIAALLFLVALPFHEMFSVEPALFGILFLITVALGRHNLALQLANIQSSPIRFGLLAWAKSAGTLLIGFAFVHYGAGGRGALLGFLSGLVLAVSAFAPESMSRAKFRSVDTPTDLDMFRFGLPLTLNFLAFILVDVSNRFTIGGLLGTALVAPYAVAYDFVLGSIGALMHVLFLAAFPLVIQALEGEGDEAARIRIRTLGRALVGIGFPAVVGLSILSGEISEILFGEGFRQDTAMIMPWLAVAFFIGCFKTYYFDLVFQLRYVTKYQGRIAVLMAVINVFLNFFLLPNFGIMGAAWSTLATFSVGALVSWRVGRRVFALPSLGNVFSESLFASVAMAIVIYSLPPSPGIVWLSAKIALGILTYLAMAWVLDVAGCRGFIDRLVRRRIK